MTLNETAPYDEASQYDGTDDVFSLIGEVRAVVSTVLVIEGESEVQRREQYAIAFRGVLQLEPDEAYQRLASLLEPLGFTPFLQRDRGQDVVLAVQGLPANLEAETGGGPLRRLLRASGRSPWWLHLALLLATIATTMYAGALLLDGEAVTLGEVLATGGPFALTLLLILGVHEMGHYLAARYHRVKVTLPFFIPLPIPGSLGTLGAVIFIRSPLNNRRALFDVGISGPLAGLAVALPLFMIGLLLPPIEFGAPIYLVFRGVGVPPLLQWMGEPLAEGSLSRAILFHPVALAAWFGVLLTALNLLPLGQFDGGHVSYALFGRRAWPLAGAVFIALIVLGFFYWPTWLVWAFLAGMTGLRHPPPQNDITPLDGRRQLIGLLTLLLFLLIVVPQPIRARQATFMPSGGDGTTPLPTIAPPNIPTPTPFVFPSGQ